MVIGAGIDWTQVMVALIAVLPATLSAVFAYKITRAIKTPSGDSIGTQVERTNELAIVNTQMTKDIHTAVRHGDDEPPTEV